MGFNNVAHSFKLNSESLRREYAVYVVIISAINETKLYVGKTGDNREGCNPIISRCGNHFSYNKIHSQIRNKIKKHENYEYSYVFEHFGKYPKDSETRKKQVDQINEMERWLNLEIQKLSKSKYEVLNPYKGTGYIKPIEKTHRASFHTKMNELKIMGIVEEVKKLLKAYKN